MAASFLIFSGYDTFLPKEKMRHSGLVHTIAQLSKARHS